jgi:uncharacterized protein (TIGR02145 family)
MRSCITLFCLFLALVSTASAQDTVQVYQGWNILGSVIDGSAPEVLTTVPDSIITTSMFGYLPGTGYLSGDTLKKGLGYWVKVSADGIVIFKYSPSDDGCRGSAFSYQDRFYHTVKIGGQCWMADNLDVGAMITGNINQTDNAVIEKHCYNNDLLNCAHYGGLYQWDEAMQYVTTAGAQGICPAGWHLPTQAEFGTLSTSVGGDGNALKAIGQGSGGGSGTKTDCSLTWVTTPSSGPPRKMPATPSSNT